MYGGNSAITSYVFLCHAWGKFTSHVRSSPAGLKLYIERGVKSGWCLKTTRHFNVADTTYFESGTTNNAMAMKWSVCILERFLLNNERTEDCPRHRVGKINMMRQLDLLDLNRKGIYTPFMKQCPFAGW